MERQPCRSTLAIVAARLQDASVPFGIASRPLAELGKFGDESLGIWLIVHNSYRLNVLTAKATVELIRGRRQLRIAVMLDRRVSLAHP